MNASVVVGVAVVVSIGSPAFAHRLDEYLQATTFSVRRDRVEAQIRLAPGVSVFPAVLAAVDTDGDGAVSEAEVRAYGERVLRDLSLTIDGERVPVRLLSAESDTIQELKEGQGEIRLAFESELPRGGGDRTLVFENHHESSIAAYLVNCEVPSDPDVRVTGQDRSYDQSFYRLRYAVAPRSRRARATH